MPFPPPQLLVEGWSVDEALEDDVLARIEEKNVSVSVVVVAVAVLSSAVGRVGICLAMRGMCQGCHVYFQARKLG